MQKIMVYGNTLEVGGNFYDFSEYAHTEDLRFLLDVVDKFDRSNKHAFYDVKKQVVNYLIRCYELDKAPKVYEVL